MWLIAAYLPGFSVDIPGGLPATMLLFFFGGVFALPAVAAFRSAGTTVDPRDPGKASQLVVGGVYRYSRNPMYVGLLFLLAAWAFYLSNLLGFAGLPVFVLSMNRLQIALEEQAMEARFGDEYRAYRKSVRRWI